MTSLSLALAWATVHVSEGTSAFITITLSSMVLLVIIVIASRGATASAALCMPRYHWLHEPREYARARFGRSEERRVGKESVSTGRPWWSLYHHIKKKSRLFHLTIK